MNYVCSKSRSGLRFVSFLLLASICAFAQSDTASITGFVHDASRATIPNANVVVKNEATGVERRAVTNQSGYYAVSSLPPGLYTITVEAPGFKRFEKSQNKLDPNLSSTVDIDMQVGTASETVTVVAEAAALQSESATVGKVITSSQVKNMPLNGRNPVLLALLKPGVSGGALAGFTFGLSTGGLNINGSRTQDNLITYDGAVAVRTRSNGTSIGVADIDSVQEVQILTANYNAEYGRSAGGQVRIVTKSGGRQFHGDAYEYFRNSALNANSWTRNQTVGRQDISSRPAPFRFNQPGYDISGPLLIPKVNPDRNKLFFLFSQEWTRYRQEDLTTVTVPSVAMRNGDFSALLTANTYFSGPRYIRDPLRTGTCSAADQTACFPGNIIPANRISPNGRALLNSYPLPVAGFLLGTNNFVQSRNTTDDQRKDTGAVDYLPKENHYIRFRLQNYNLAHNDAFRGGTDRAPSTLDRPNQTASLNYIWTVSPTFVNEALVTASADHVKIFVQPGRYQRSTYGINYPYIFQAKEITDKIPTISLTGFTDIDGGPYPSSSAGPIYGISDNITKIFRNHTIKGGFQFERAGQNDFDQINVSGIPGGTNNQNGRFEFRDTRPGGSGLAVADTVLGLYSSYAELGTRSYTPYRGHMYEWFLQDTWKATRQMTLYYGIRHTIVQPYYSLWRNMSVFDIPSYDPKNAVQLDPRSGFVLPGVGDIYNGLIIPGSGFTPEAKGRFPASTDAQYQRLFKGDKSYSQTHYKDFQPRLGIAYAFNEKTVLRTGVGRFFTRLGVSDSVFLGGNPPFQPTVSTTNGLVDNPAGNTSNVNFPLIVTTQDPIFKNPEAWTWNATVERELGYGTTVEIGYVGRRGLNQQRERNINQLLPGTLQANPGINADFLRPYKGYGFIRTTNNESTSRYNGLQIEVSRRMSKGLSFGFAYTLSKLYDSGSAQRDIIPNAYDAHNLWAPSDYDRRHVAVVNFVWQLPIFRNQSTLLGKIAGGWQLSTIAQFQTGTPFSVAKGDDYAGVGPGSGSQFWDITGDPHLADANWSPGGTADSNFYFNKSAFKQPAPGTFVTNTVRNTLYNPGFQNWTAALFKKFTITENQSVQFRSEFYNFPNHPNWSNPTNDPTSSAFGKITAKNFERSLQLSLRYSF